jgi:hypothetical protein
MAVTLVKKISIFPMLNPSPDLFFAYVNVCNMPSNQGVLL